MTAEAERVGDGNVDRHFDRLVRGDVQIAFRIGLLVADGRRNDALADGHDARNRLDRSRAAQQMAGHGLGGGYLYLVCFVTERFLDGDGLVFLVERRGRTVRVDIVNVGRSQTGILNGTADCMRRCLAVRRGAGDVICVAGCAVARNLCKDGRAALLRVGQALRVRDSPHLRP